MIDYEKLKKAHDMCDATEGYYFNITLGLNEGTIYLFDANNPGDDFVCNPEDLDDLIIKLEELTQPKTKYEIGQEIWFVVLGLEWSPIESQIESYNNGQYYVSGHWYKERDLYPTKQALIEAQIDHWVNQLKQIPEFSALTGQYILQTKQDEYCQVSGASLGRPKIQDAPFAGSVPIEKIQAPVDSVSKCQHESDAKYYTYPATSIIGEFYR